VNPRVMALLDTARWVDIDPFWDRWVKGLGRWGRQDQAFVKRDGLRPGVLVTGLPGQGPSAHVRYAVVAVNGHRMFVSEGRWTDTEALAASRAVAAESAPIPPVLGPCHDGEGGGVTPVQ
jgi:hypothetical protein